MAAPLLELRGIAKRFPGVVALGGVDLSVGVGEVLALIGENGAGKSTLMKILGGVQQADEGSIAIDGAQVVIRTVNDAARFGIAFIHQELSNFDNLDVGANIFMGREPRRAWGRSVLGPLALIDRARIDAESRVHLRRLGLDIDPRTPLAALSLAQQQMVEIAKALSQQARLIIMDEPTSCLTLTETERLLATIAELRAQQVSIIYISHRLHEIEVCADRVAALRDGRNSGGLAKNEITHDAMVRLMIGRDLLKVIRGVAEPAGEHSQNQAKPEPTKAKGIELRGVRTQPHPAHAINLEIRRGEILGLAGLVGAGRTELARALFGVEPRVGGAVSMDGRELRLKSAREAIDAGIFLVPEDRRHLGLITEMTIRENISLPSLSDISAAGLIKPDPERTMARQGIEALQIKTPSSEALARNLSGGNQQKVVLAKWMARNPALMIFDEPTRGIDVGAKAEIYKLMRALADRGVAILMISSDMEEVLAVSDRIAVMSEGRLMGTIERAEFSEAAVMKLAVGAAQALVA